jgi:hypothetical protein
VAKRTVKSVDRYWKDRFRPMKKLYCLSGLNRPSRTIVESRDRDDVGDDE